MGDGRTRDAPECVDWAIQARPDTDARDEFACDGCGDVVESLSVLTSFRVEIEATRGHAPVLPQVCARRASDLLDG
ncbi:hypothetical protein GCM10009021_28390 [Halarchaeum nitratireducens]|uniref:Uncharacterized protein n=1 Tax=Halarchaeum nitratireducens TaxID=489913 RepID=A0A830GGK4_9EURY|nr:hypothetical protein GCM10009021_28390 [Halarchaeum nitratireducens]